MPTQMERAKTNVRRAKIKAGVKIAKAKKVQSAKGKAQIVKGTLRDVAGGALGKPRMKAKGKLQKAVGKARVKLSH